MLVERLGVATRFYVEPQQRFGVGAAQVEAPVGEFHAEAVGGVDGCLLRGEVGADAIDRRRDVGDAVVDLATARECGNAFIDQLRQRLAGFGHQRSDQQPWDHAAIAIGEVAEVVVRAHLAGIDGILGAHAFLDEGVAGLRLDGDAARLRDLVDGVPGEAGVVDDLGAGLTLEHHLGEQADEVIALDEASVGVEEETAVEVAVPGNGEVAAVFEQSLAGELAVFRQQRVGHAVGEVAVRLTVDENPVEGQVLGQCFDDRAGGAVAGVGEDLERFERCDIHIAEQVLDVGGLGCLVLDGAGLRRHRAEVAGDDAVADSVQARVAADGLRRLAHQLHAVVALGVVAGGDHDAAAGLLVAGGEVDFLGAAQADVDDVGAAFGDAADERLSEHRAFEAHVATDDDGLGAQFGDERVADAVGDFFVELIGHAATDVVGLEGGDGHGGWVAHGPGCDCCQFAARP